MLINDAHVHVGNSETMKHGHISFDNLLTIKDKYKIDNMVVMPFNLEIPETNKKLVEMGMTEKSLKVFYWLTEADKNAIAVLKENAHIAGIKFHGRFDNKPVTHLAYRKVMQYLNDIGGRILVHTGRYLEGAKESNTSYLHAVELASEFPSLTVIMAHMGGSDTTICEKAILKARHYPNIMFDTCGITTPHIIEFALEHVNVRRILFASDVPWCSFNAMLHNVLDAEISESERTAILSDNFVREFAN